MMEKFVTYNSSKNVFNYTSSGFTYEYGHLNLISPFAQVEFCSGLFV